MANFLNGLLGNFTGGANMPTDSLLGQYYDPAAMRRYQMKHMLLGLGAGLLTEKGIGRGAALAAAAAANAGSQYRDNAMDAYKIKTAQDEQAYRREQDKLQADRWSKSFALQAAQEARAAEAAQIEANQRDAANEAWGNIRKMPSTGVPVQNYGLADQLYKMGRVDDALKTVTPQTPETMKPTDDMREYALAVQQGYTGSFQQYMLDMKKAGAQNINVNGGGSDKQIYDSMQVQSDAANAARRGMSSINEAQAALPGAITGAGAEQRLSLQKVGALMGVADTSAITNTETFRSAIAPQVAAMLKATVGSTQISNADREFAEKAAGGSISLDKSSIERLLNIMQAANSEVIRGFNAKIDKVYPDGQGFDRERALFGVENVPKRYASPIGPQPQQGAFPQPNATSGPLDPANPRPGDVVLGYRFKGGDRRDPNNWEKVQ